MRLLAPLLLLLAVAGCAKFESWFYPERAKQATTPAGWTGSGASEEQLSGDLASCRAQARAVIGRDQVIDSDIGRYDRDIGDEVELREQMDQFTEQRRYQQIVSDCMQQLGYGAPDAAATETEAPAAP